MAEALAFVDDIFFQAKIRETAKLVGVDVHFCTTPDALFAEMDREKPNLVVIDLNARNSPLDAIARARSASAEMPMVCFLSHVQVELAEKARVAGCDNVMPRSKFTHNLATILAQAKSHSS
jgi:AmiR/NasT family two-component response regulator